MGKSKIRKVGGVGDISPEHFKTLITTNEGLELVVQLCQWCWGKGITPKVLENPQVALLFKKGAPSNCANDCQTISLCSKCKRTIHLYGALVSVCIPLCNTWAQI